MKKLIIVMLMAVLVSNVSADKAPEFEIAIYDSKKLQQQVGYQALRELEYGDKYRKSIAELKRKLAKLEDRLIAAENEEELKRVNLESSFVKNKISSIKSLAQTRASRGNDRIELTALIKKSFSGKYAVILQKNSGSDIFRQAIHANVKYVDITDEILSIVAKELTPKAGDQ